MANIKFLLMAVFLIVKNVNAEIIDVPVAPGKPYPKCTGSLVIVTKNRNGDDVTTKRFSESKNITGLQASSLKVEGCGCFYLYKRPYFKSTSKLINHHMTRNIQNISGDYIGYKIRSIEKVSCEGIKSDEGSFWTAGVGVVGGVSLLIVIIMATVGIKCYKKYKSAHSPVTLTTPPSTPSQSLA